MTVVPDVQPIDWQVAENAIYDWIVAELELRECQVIWANQSVPQPPYPYVSLNRNTEVDVGLNEKRQRTLDVDGKVVGVDPSAGDPYENEEIVYQPINWTLIIDAHVDVANGGNDPNCNAMFLVGKAKRSLGKTSVNQQLWDAGVSVARPLAAVDTSSVVNTVWVSRATLDVLMHSVSVTTERHTFIESVQVVSEQLGVDLLVDAG